MTVLRERKISDGRKKKKNRRKEESKREKQPRILMVSGRAAELVFVRVALSK